MFDFRRFSLFLLLVIVSIVLQLRMGELFGNSFEFIFIALVVCSLFDSPIEHFFLTLAALFLCNWRPGIAWELVVLLSIPLGIVFFRDRFPWRQEFTMLVASSLGVVAIYTAAGGVGAVLRSSLFWIDLGGSTLIGFLLFRIIQSVYYPKARGFGSIYALPR